MKLNNSKFEDYLSNYSNNTLHPTYKSVYDDFPDDIKELKNHIFYGPEGVGKYTQLLASINRYSPSKLTYEKKICISYSKQPYYIKISDIHFEVDMSLLGCNTKLLWNDLFNQIVDIILTKPDETGIIVCKNFQNISNELLETFYSYMQTNNTSSVNIIFMLLTTQISFIPDAIRNRTNIINFSRPSRTQYTKCLGVKINKGLKLEHISNIKNVNTNITQLMIPHRNICNKVIHNIINVNDSSFIEVREVLYDIFIYDLDMNECIFYILTELIKKRRIKSEHIAELFNKTARFLQYFNNNYRPIYHLESYIFYLTKAVHDYS